MFKGNLSTRPFYNERIVSLLVAVGAVGALALTAFNVLTIQALNTQRARNQQEVEQFAVQTRALDAGARSLEHSVDRPALLALAAGTHEANALIDERTFSWTAFFGLMEDTIPMDVRLIAVSPRVERGEFRISMIINAKRHGEIADFIDNLMDTGAFYDLLPAEQQRNDDGSFTATLSAAYLPPGRQPAATRAGGRPTP